MRKRFIMCLLMAVSYSLPAQTLSIPGQISKNYDSHVVVKGETLYSLSKRYHTTVNVLLELNPGIINNNLETGKVILVPLIENEGAAFPDEKLSSHDRAVMHKVEKGETVYSLSKKFNTDVSTILMWNDLKEPLIREGEMLVVGYEMAGMKAMGPFPVQDSEIEGENERPISPANEKRVEAGSNPEPSLSASKSLNNEPELRRANSRKEIEVLHDEKGIALWTSSTYDGGNFYALHSTAPQGTEILVKNLMNERTVVVKVVGRLPSIPENGNVLIKLSESAAKKLNVLDEKFLVELSYSLPVTSGNTN